MLLNQTSKSFVSFRFRRHREVPAAANPENNPARTRARDGIWRDMCLVPLILPRQNRSDCAPIFQPPSNVHPQPCHHHLLGKALSCREERVLSSFLIKIDQSHSPCISVSFSSRRRRPHPVQPRVSTSKDHLSLTSSRRLFLGFFQTLVCCLSLHFDCRAKFSGILGDSSTNSW